MPIGASKVGALGGLVPGGSVTFNTSDTWVVPPGVKKVSITGKGGTGNPGVAGNPGNPGNPGNGGSGGAGRPSSIRQCPSPNAPQSEASRGGAGGSAWKYRASNPTQLKLCNPMFPYRQCGTVPTHPQISLVAVGGWINPFPCGANVNATVSAGQGGTSGTAGTAGNPGTAGNSGQASSALCNTFPGGTGGNAPPGGTAGNGGTGGSGGGEGGRNGPGAAGNSGGAGGSGSNYTGPFLNMAPSPVNAQNYYVGAGGGGGAGVTNSGAAGNNNIRTVCGSPSCNTLFYARGGTTSGISGGPMSPSPQRYNVWQFPRPPTTFCTSTTGGSGGSGAFGSNLNCYSTGNNSISVGACDASYNQSLVSGPSNGFPNNRGAYDQFNPACVRPNIWRSGAGGGSSSLVSKSVMTSMNIVQIGGGGGGGGRGNAGNAGGNSPTVSGSAATPLTFNCVPVTPGAPYPITVGGPSGGQIVISWNPQ